MLARVCSSLGRLRPPTSIRLAQHDSTGRSACPGQPIQGGRARQDRTWPDQAGEQMTDHLLTAAQRATTATTHAVCLPVPPPVHMSAATCDGGPMHVCSLFWGRGN